MRNRIFGLASIAAVSLFLGACGFVQDNATVVPVEPTPSGGAVPAGLEKFYSQPFKWDKCPEGVPESGPALCGKFNAPKDYANPEDGDLEIMAVRVSSDGEYHRAIMVNPGGPGGSAVDFVAENHRHIFSDSVLNKYDVVGMDSRGTKWSTPVDCLSNEELDKQISEDSPDVDTEEGRLEARRQMAEIGSKCLDHGDTAKWVDTVSAARDMDILRHLMGQEKIDYLGFSYGTFLGATYADLFPKNVDHMVLDGVVDPSASYEQVSKLQLQGFDSSLEHFVNWCVDNNKDCVLEPGQQGMKQISQLLQDLRVRSLPTGDEDRPLTSALAETAIFGAMYNDQWFPTLADALNEALRDNDGSGLLRMADTLNERNGDGSFESNQTEAFLAINNLDYPLSNESTWQSNADELKRISPLFWQSFSWGDYSRADWPIEPVGKRQPIHAEGAPPVVLIGTTHDPATPMVMAESLAKQMKNSVLVTKEGWNHTAYSSAADDCVKDAVDNFFLQDKLPEKGLVCK